MSIKQRASSYPQSEVAQCMPELSPESLRLQSSHASASGCEPATLRLQGGVACRLGSSIITSNTAFPKMQSSRFEPEDPSCLARWEPNLTGPRTRNPGLRFLPRARSVIPGSIGLELTPTGYLVRAPSEGAAAWVA